LPDSFDYSRPDYSCVHALARRRRVKGAASILAHNHPSGVAEPSQADLDITKQLKKVLELVEIKVLDHFIAGGDTVSFAERCLI
jgi:DNA repair protein RadC